MQKFILLFFIPVADIQSHQDFLEAVAYFIPRNVEYHAILLGLEGGEG